MTLLHRVMKKESNRVGPLRLTAVLILSADIWQQGEEYELQYC